MVTDHAQPNAPQARAAAPARHRYAMISSEIRRDLQAPLARFRRLDIYHFYRSAPWNDMKAGEFDERTIRFRLPFDLFWKLRAARPEIIQGPEPLSLLMLPFLLATLAYLWLNPGVRLVTLSLEPIPLERKYNRPVAALFRLVLGWWFRRATVIFWFDQGSRRNLLANGAPPAKLANLIYGSWGIDPAEFSPEGPRAHLPAGAPVVLYVGRLSHVKGVSYLIAAFRRLLDSGQAAHLAIVGDGPERRRLEAQARALGLEGRVSWHGTVKNADLPPYMRAAQLLVLPSISTRLWVQQLSITAWQAMGCGLPVIATDTGCMDEFTPPAAGLLVPERDPQALALAMLAVLSNPARRAALSAGARAYALERFDAVRNVQRAEETILAWCA